MPLTLSLPHRLLQRRGLIPIIAHSEPGRSPFDADHRQNRGSGHGDHRPGQDPPGGTGYLKVAGGASTGVKSFNIQQ